MPSSGQFEATITYIRKGVMMTKAIIDTKADPAVYFVAMHAVALCSAPFCLATEAAAGTVNVMSDNCNPVMLHGRPDSNDQNFSSMYTPSTCLAKLGWRCKTDLSRCCRLYEARAPERKHSETARQRSQFCLMVAA